MDICEKEQQRFDILGALPVEISLHCLSFLDASSVCNAAATNKYWNMLTRDNLLWKSLCYQLEINAPMYGFGNYKESYKYRARLLKRWQKGEFQTVTKLVEGDNDFSCLHYNDRYVAAGSFDKTIKVWSLFNLQQILTLEGHSDIVSHVKFSGERIFSCSRDGTMKIWNFEGECLHTVALHHGKAVRYFQVVEDETNYAVLSAGEDMRVVLWNIEEGNAVEQLYTHDNIVTVLAYDKDTNTLISGSRDAVVKVFSFDTRSLVTSFKSHTDSITCLSFSKSRIITGSRDKTVKAFDRSTYKCLLTIPHTHWLTAVACDDDKVLSNCIDSGDLTLHSLKNGELLHTFKSHTKLIRAIQFDYAKIVTCSNDGSVAILSFDDCGRRMSTVA
eukprot:Nk52_evm94s208 gene=Nk52_evmTU94s208